MVIWHNLNLWWLNSLHISVIRFKTLRLRQNGRQFPVNIFKCIFLNENVRISITIAPNFVLNSPIDNIPALVQIMAWRRPGYKPLSEPMMISLLMHICITQWVKEVNFQMYPIQICFLYLIICFIHHLNISIAFVCASQDITNLSNWCWCEGL